MFSKAFDYLVTALITLGVVVQVLGQLLATVWLIVQEVVEFVVFQLAPPFLLIMVLALAMDLTDRLT